MTDFILFGGKGGVGKTTCASATALSLAKNENKTLVVSTDPAHSISDIFEVEVYPEPTRVREEYPLYAAEVDPKHQFTENYSGAATALINEAGKYGININVDDFSDFDGEIIGSDEAAVIDLFAEYEESEVWDYVIFDTAPTGHTLRMLKLPEVLDSTVGTILNVKSQISGVKNTVTSLISSTGKETNEDEKTVEDIDIDKTRQKLNRVSEVLQNKRRTQFFAVMEPEDLSLLETQRLLNQLENYNVPVGGVIVNKILQDINEDCSLCSSRYEQQQEVLTKTEESIDVPQLKIELQDSTPTGDRLDYISDRITVS